MSQTDDEVKALKKLDKLYESAQYHQTYEMWQRYRRALREYTEEFVKGRKDGDEVGDGVPSSRGPHAHTQRRLESRRDDSRSHWYRNKLERNA